MTLIIHGHGADWELRVKEWEPHTRFTVEQVDGPYTEYRHERVFEPYKGGTRVLEKIEYAHLGGSLYQRLVIQPELEMLYSFRHRRVLEKYGLDSVDAAGQLVCLPRDGLTRGSFRPKEQHHIACTIVPFRR